MPAGVIFDMDGVLIDSYRAHFQSWQDLAAEYGSTYTEADFVRGFGRTSREVLAEQWRGRIADLNEERIVELDAKKEAHFRRIITAHFPAMNGARDLICALASAGFRIAVGSSGPPENVLLAIERLRIGPALSGKVTGADVTRGKPDPQVFLLAAERLRLSPDRCVVIEDAVPGIRAAHAAGMKCFGLVSTGHTPEELHEADAVIASLREITPERIRSMLPARGSTCD